MYDCYSVIPGFFKVRWNENLNACSWGYGPKGLLKMSKITINWWQFLESSCSLLSLQRILFWIHMQYKHSISGKAKENKLYRPAVKLTFFSNYQLLNILKYTKHHYMFDSVAQWWGFWLTPDQHPVFRRPISFNPGLNFNTGFFFFCLKAFSRIIFPILFRAFNHLTADQKN